MDRRTIFPPSCPILSSSSPFPIVFRFLPTPSSPILFTGYFLPFPLLSLTTLRATSSLFPIPPYSLLPPPPPHLPSSPLPLRATSSRRHRNCNFLLLGCAEAETCHPQSARKVDAPLDQAPRKGPYGAGLAGPESGGAAPEQRRPPALRPQTNMMLAADSYR